MLHFDEHFDEYFSEVIGHPNHDFENVTIDA